MGGEIKVKGKREEGKKVCVWRGGRSGNVCLCVWACVGTRAKGRKRRREERVCKGRGG